MNIFKEIYNLYLANKGTFDTLFGIILGSFFTHVITTNQVKKNNKFILIEVKNKSLLLLQYFDY